MPAGRCAVAWVGSALLVLAAPRCAPQDVYFYDPEVQTVGASPDAGVPDAEEPAGDEDEPVLTPPDDTDEPYEPVQPACESEACERCLETASCAGSTLSLCHPQSGSCVAGCDPGAADDAGNCAQGTRCDETRGLCLECVTSQDCAAPTPVCDAASGSCVGCVGDYDCTPLTPVCDTDAHECIGCRIDADCAATFEVCRESVARCVECESDADCIARPEPGDDDDDDRLCSPELRCVECLSDDDCSDPDKPICTSELECDDERE